MQSKGRKEANKTFSSFLEKEFLQDLEFATGLTSIQEEERTPEQQKSLILLMCKYSPEGKCPSSLFPSVSKELQEEYNTIHNKICNVLYEPSSC
jgi:hypothetical protein